MTSIYRACTMIGMLLLAQSSSAFVLLSGPAEAKLTVSAEAPTLNMLWDQKAPSIEKKDELVGGAWAHLNDVEYMEQIIGLAMQQWNQVPGSFLQLALVVDPTTLADQKDLVHSIVTKNSNNLSTAAFARPIVDKDVITDCDITITNRKTSAKSLAYTITHELGHCIGLGHAHTNYKALMGYSRSNRSVSLGVDDMAGIIYLYPDPAYGDTPPLPLKCGTIVGRGSLKMASTWWLMLLPLLSLGRVCWRYQRCRRSPSKP